MLVPTGVIFIWPSTHASIPAGWQRETTLDDKYVKGTADAVDPDVTGGAAIHGHTSPEHTHVMSHVHTGRSDEADISGGWSVSCSNEGTNGCYNAHRHLFTSNNPTDGSLVDAITYASVNHEPPYRKVIFVKPTAGFAPLKANMIGLFGSATVPTGWLFCDGGGGTPDLRNRYLKGPSTDADSDVTTDNGALTHTHVLDHIHTPVNHTHAGTTNAAVTDQRSSQAGNDINHYSHTHTFTLAAVSQAGAVYTGNIVSGTIEPLYKKLLAIKNTSGGNSLPKGIIGMWLGTLATVPIGWFLCDGNGGRPDMRGYHLKIANTTGEIGNTGGANTHVHSPSNSHPHAGASHGHAVPGMSQNATQVRNPDGSGWYAIKSNHVHNQGSGYVDAATSVYSSVAISGDSINSEPPYRTVAFLQYKYSTGGLPLMALL